MSRRKITIGWQLVTTLVVDIVNPLLLISLALFMSVGYILTLLIPVNIEVWATILCISVLLPLFALLYRERLRWQQKRQHVKPFSWRALLPLIPLLIFLPVFIVVLLRPSIDGIWHMDIYAVYSQQIFHRLAPPESIFVPGFAATHYWLFHALSAVIVRIIMLDVYSAYQLVNAVCFFASLFWVAQSLIALNLAKSRTLELGFAVVFVFGSVNLAGCLIALTNLFTDAEAASLSSIGLIQGADSRLVSTYTKMMFASGMTPAVMAFTATLYGCICVLQGKTDFVTLTLLSASVIITLGAMPIVAPFLVFPMFGGVLLVNLKTQNDRGNRSGLAISIVRRLTGAIDLFPLGLWLLLSFALAIPLVKYGLDMSEHARHGSSFISVDKNNLWMTLTAQLLLIPFFFAHAYFAIGTKKIIHYFVLVAGILGFVIVLSVVLPQRNQYKYHFPLSMILALSALFILRWQAQHQDKRWRSLGKVLTLSLFGLAFVNAIYGNSIVIDRILRRQGSASYSGINVQPASDWGRRQSAYAWIRDHTPLEAIVVAPHTYTKTASLFHERLHYVRIGMSNHVENNPVFDRRVSELHEFYDSSTSIEGYTILLQSMQSQLPGRPFYAVVNDSEVSREIMEARRAVRVFEHPAAGSHVYLLNPDPIQ